VNLESLPLEISYAEIVVNWSPGKLASRLVKAGVGWCCDVLGELGSAILTKSRFG
jgi:hypothetical protein